MSKSLVRRCTNRLFGLLARFSPGAKSLRPMLHRARGVKIGADVFIGDDVYLDNEYPESIEIGDRVQIAVRTVIIAHTRGPGRVIIEQDAFLGAGCILTCSSGRVVRIGAGAVIGAGTVVTKSVPPRLYLAPAAPQCLARVEVPLTTTGSMDAFHSGLRPVKPRATETVSPPPAGAKPPSP